MVVVGIGSRSSPIVIDDDDDDGPIPPKPKTDSSSSSSVKGTPPQQSTPADIAPARDTTPARQENPDQLTSGKGYSILVRMGYKPGYGLGVNFEGVTSPIKARVRPKELSAAGIGASNVISSRNRSSRDAPNAGPATTGSQLTAPVPKHAHETRSSSLLTKTSIIPTRRSSGHFPNDGNHLTSPPEKIPCDSSSVSPGVHLGSTDGSVSTDGGGICKVNTAVKTSTEHCPDSHHSNFPQDVGNTRPPTSRVPPSSTNVPLRFFFPDLFPVQSVPLHLPPPPVNSQGSVPVNIPLSSVNLPSRPIVPNLPSRPPSPQTFGIPYVTRSRGKSVIGMPLDDAKVGGTRGSFPKKLDPPPNLSCSLVMETLPRKFRTDSFILDWLSQFTFEPRQYELVEGKAFFEFKTQRDAKLAWKSPRMGGMEGLFGVRLFWYRVLPQPVLKDMDTIRKVNATGTIENPARSSLLPVPYSSTDNLEHPSEFKVDLSHSQIPPSPPHSTAIEEDPGVTVNVNPPTEASRSNSNKQTSQGGGSTLPSPPVTTRSLAACRAPSDPADNMDADCAMRDLSPGVPGLIPVASVSPTVVSMSSSPALSSSSAQPSSRTSSSVFPSFSPEVLNPAVTTTLIDHQASPALNQGPMQASNLVAESSHMKPEVRGFEFEKADGTPLGADDFMDTTDAAALAKEQALRRMVLQSRKRKLLEPSSIKQPTPAASSTATSGNALQDLAVNFIADAIARPPPAKIVKITPSASAMAAWGKRLEQHVKSSKAIMENIHSSRSRVERNRLMAVLRDKNRRIELEKMTLYACPVEEVVPVSPWPDSHPDHGILELSDTDDDEGDYGSDDGDDMEGGGHNAQTMDSSSYLVLVNKLETLSCIIRIALNQFASSPPSPSLLSVILVIVVVIVVTPPCSQFIIASFYVPNHFPSLTILGT
ncbi:hypothetical protein F5888DRAFT_1799436 [Russula emetica]|nr:hypothetical protein F5888DRAFT_1799436 [Russula emetica]